MSEQNQKNQPDEVLASVRRLVTAMVDTQSPADEKKPVEKLLLTPALRVGGEGAPPEPATAAPEPVAPPTTRQRAPQPPGVPLEQRIAELEAAVGRQTGEWEPDGSELVDEETPHRFVFQHTPRDPEPEDTLLLETPAKDALQEPATAPQEDARDAMSGPADPEPAAAGETARSVELGDDMLIDEDMLRDMVAEIVRSELQGELGERITRNVRKLVRREIHRAIMTRDFG